MKTLFLSLIFVCFGVNAAVQWNETLHDRLLQYAASAYCPQQRIDSWICTYCTGNVNVSYFFNGDGTNTFGYGGVDYDNNLILMVFRGTVPTSLKNWITDLDFAKMTDYQVGKNARVHSGFLQAYRTIREDVQNAIDDLRSQNPTMGVAFVGHSLGAALSSLAAIDYSYSNPGVSIVSYNYGCPRIGNSGFAQAYSSLVPTFRVINQRDIVPHLPFEELGFIHPTREVWYNYNDVYQLCSTSNGEDPNCADSIFPDLITGIADHIMYMNGVGMGVGNC